MMWAWIFALILNVVLIGIHLRDYIDEYVGDVSAQNSGNGWMRVRMKPYRAVLFIFLVFFALHNPLADQVSTIWTLIALGTGFAVGGLKFSEKGNSRV